MTGWSASRAYEGIGGELAERLRAWGYRASVAAYSEPASIDGR